MDDGTPDTSWNGRRLPEAESYITEKLSSALQEANGWTTGTWGCTADELSELQVCVRGTYHLAWLRHEYLKKLPWRFCRVHEPGMAAKVIEQYDTHSQHDSVSHYFLSPDGPWRAHIEAITPDGGNISPELSRELRFSLLCPWMILSVKLRMQWATRLQDLPSTVLSVGSPARCASQVTSAM